jgi:hypothetical protein
MFFGELITLLIDNFFEFLISGYLQIRMPLNSTDGEKIASYVSYIGLFLSIGFLLTALIVQMFFPLSKFGEPGFSKIWGELTESIKLTNKWNISFYLVFAIRRVFYCTIAFFVT